MRKNIIIPIILICLLLLPIDAFATLAKVGAEANFDGDINLTTGSKVLFNEVQISSDDLSDVASIAMLDENEDVTGEWAFFNINIINNELLPSFNFYSVDGVDGSVSENNELGALIFNGFDGVGYSEGAYIIASVDGTPGEEDMPGRLEFWTTPDGSDDPVKRQAIDNAGNIKMGDGAWTNYINTTNAGVMTAVGSATITATTVTGFTPASGSLTLAGADALTLTTTGETNSTLPLGTKTLAATDVATLSSLTSIGTIATGTWEATDIAPSAGGTGVSNNDASTLTISGNFATTLTVTEATGVTLPASGTLLANIVEDTTPDLGGELDAGAHSIGFALQSTTGDGTTTIDWTLGNKFKFTFGAQNETFTFTQPTNPCTLMLTIIQDATGSRTITWPATVKWPAGTAPTLTTTANARDKIALDWDGAQYDGVCSKDFK